MLKPTELSVFAVLDSKANAFMTPVHFMYKGQATRWFDDVLKERDLPFSKHPEDYSLYHLGYFDQYTGRLETLTAPELIIRATEIQPSA